MMITFRTSLTSSQLLVIAVSALVQYRRLP